MKTLKEFRQQLQEKVKSLHAFDLDDTVFKSPHLKVHVKNEHGKRVKSLDTHEFSHHSQKPLPKGHKYDFSDFKSSKKFHQHAKPIHKMISRMRLHTANKNSKVIISTARANMDDKHKFLHTLKKHGINTKKVHVVRHGDMKGGSTGEKKRLTFSGYIKKHKVKDAHFYDDDKNNLKHVLSLKKKHPNTRIYGHHAQSDGSTKPYSGD